MTKSPWSIYTARLARFYRFVRIKEIGDRPRFLRHAHRLDVVPLAVEQEGAVVVGRVVLAQARRAVVLRPGLQPRRMERIHPGPVLRLEADVRPAAAFVGVQPQRRLVLGAEARV